MGFGKGFEQRQRTLRNSNEALTLDMEHCYPLDTACKLNVH